MGRAWRGRAACGVVLVVGLAGCAGNVAPGAPVPGLSAPQAGASTRPGAAPGGGQDAGQGIVARPASTSLQVEARNVRLVRNGTDELALQFEFHNGMPDRVSPSWFGIDLVERLLLLVDLPRATGYGVLDVPNTGAKGRLSANVDDYVQPGASATVTAVFAAPPAETTSMLVSVDPLLPVQAPVQPAGSAALTPDPILHAPPGEHNYVGPLVCADDSQGGQTSFRLPADVLFGFGSAALSPAAQGAIEALSGQVTGKSGTVTVQGNTDGIGGDAYNQTLSEQRAASVAAALKGKLTGDFSYTSVGFGKTKPVAPNTNPDGSDNPDGRARNRRVDIVVDSGSGTPRPDPRTPDLNSDAAGLRASVTTVARLSGYLLTTAQVTNPTGDWAKFDYSGLYEGTAVTDGELSVRDTGGGHTASLCTVAPPVYFAYVGSMGNSFSTELTRGGKIPAGATVSVWGLTPDPAPSATSVNVRIGGFAQQFPAQVTPSS